MAIRVDRVIEFDIDIELFVLVAENLPELALASTRRVELRGHRRQFLAKALLPFF